MKALSSIVSNIPLGCKLIYFVSFVLYIIGFVFSKVPLAIANYPEKVYKDLQLYRLIVTFFSKGESVISIIAILADFLLIRFFFTKLELKYSTVFFLTQILIQNLTFQIFFTLFATIFVYANFLTSFLISYGWTPLIVIFVYKYAYKDRQQKFKVICIQIPKKYIPYIIVVLAFVFAFDQFICIGLSVVFGYLQFGLHGQHFVSLPLGFYTKLQSCIPECIKSSPNFKRVQDCELNIIEECCKGLQKKQAKQEKKSEKMSEQKKTNVTDPEKKAKKTRKTAGRKKNNKSGSGSIQFNQQIPTGRSGKDIQEDVGEQVPNIETNNELNRDNKM